MQTSYDDIYSRFLGKITDYNFANLSADDAYEKMHDWLNSIAADPSVRKIFSSFTIDDEIMTITFELTRSFDETFGKLYVDELFAKGMVISWLEPKVQSSPNFDFMIPGKESKMYSQANHITALKSMLRQEKLDFEKYVRNYSYSHFALKGAES